MVTETLISFDLKANFGVLKKPDVNDGLQPTFNLLHKPALLGILGAIAGFGGYEKKGVWPEYYLKLRDLCVSIEPLDHQNGNFTKTAIKYTNTVGYANADGNLIVTEQTLINPAYRCYLLLNESNSDHIILKERIIAGEAAYLPYIGKNECFAWWDKESVQMYTYKPFEPINDFRISSAFVKKDRVSSQKVEPRFSISAGGVINKSSFAYFERVPIGFSNNDSMTFVQYKMEEFVYTDWVLSRDSIISDLYEIVSRDGQKRIIQLF